MSLELKDFSRTFLRDNYAHCERHFSTLLVYMKPLSYTAMDYLPQQLKYSYTAKPTNHIRGLFKGFQSLEFAAYKFKYFQEFSRTCIICLQTGWGR